MGLDMIVSLKAAIGAEGGKQNKGDRGSVVLMMGFNMGRGLKVVVSALYEAFGNGGF